MLCSSCGVPTSTQDPSSPRAKAAAADRRREQNRRAQKRFRQKHREQKATPEQDQSQPQKRASDAMDTVGPTTSKESTPLTPPSCYEERQADSVVDYDCLLDPSDRCVMNKWTDDFWTSTLEETAPFAATALVLPSERKDSQEILTMRDFDDSVDKNQNGRVPAGPTVLHRAVQTGNSKVVGLLLEHNANCNTKDNTGLTPLLCAVIGGHEEVLELLLSHGASIGHVDDAHWSALHWAVFHKRHRILERLLRCCSGDSSLLNIRNKDGETPLSVAVSAGSEVAVKLLLEFGATVNIEQSS
uniref:GsfG n=1 Tax=Penicillium aethiopicum TaxID=36650 RepID=D7PI21_PENAE|nr:GsfG [Penicillium aethiopicum]